MPDSIPCADCKNEIPQPATSCPHCGRPGIFWNVIQANDDGERAELQSRYSAVKADALARGTDGPLQNFEDAIASSIAVIARSEVDVHRLANSSRQLYATYYQQLDAGVRLPDGDEWDVVREITDSLLFPKYKEHMRFAALSLDGIGLSNYGSCSIALRDDLIAHRASVVEENSVLFMERHGIKISRNADIPKGFKAIWSERDKLCVAKLARHIDSATTPNKYSSLLLKQGTSPEDDEFVEVHIFGSITVLTMAKITVTISHSGPRRTIMKALKAKLAKHGLSIAE
ncbi:MAG TPA: hypothetical protein VF290_18990 [Pyrinomonadaceae bacterium]